MKKQQEAGMELGIKRGVEREAELPEIQQMWREPELNNYLSPHRGRQETLSFPMAFQSPVLVIY